MEGFPSSGEAKSPAINKQYLYPTFKFGISACNGVAPSSSTSANNPSSPLATTMPAVGCAKCRERYRYFLQNQLHGFSSFIESRSPSERMVWSSIMASCLLIAIWQTFVLSNEYFQHTVVTLFTIEKHNRLRYPNITVCPKNVDALNFSTIEADLHFRMPHLNDSAINDLITFAMAGAGFHNFDLRLQFWRADQLPQFGRWLTRWQAGRSLQQFYHFLFEENGYRCEELFQACYYGRIRIKCCDYFSPTYVMLRGRCFRLKETYQEDQDEGGKLSLFVNRLRSPFIALNGTQPQMMVYIRYII